MGNALPLPFYAWIGTEHHVHHRYAQFMLNLCFEMVEVTPELREVFDSWMVLTPDQKSAALQMLKAMSGGK